MLVVGVEEMQSLIDLEDDVVLGSTGQLWSFVVMICGKTKVINLTGLVLERPYKTYLLRFGTSMKNRARHLWFVYKKKVVRDPPESL
jgi:hypothetical protein